MGKDKFGAKRGMCALCECKEYIKPSNESLTCDYCDHKPVYHIEVISLGTCSCPACSVYTSSKEFEYDECEFCACPAQNHKGWDQIQKQVEEIKNRFAKPTGAIESVVTKAISAPQPNPSIIAQGVPPIATPQPNVNYGGGLQSFSNPPTQPQGPQMGGTGPHGTRYDGQAQYTTQQPQPNPAALYPHSSHFAAPVTQYRQPIPQQPQTGYTQTGQGMQPQNYQQYPPQSYQQQHGHMNPHVMPQRPPNSASSNSPADGISSQYGYRPQIFSQKPKLQIHPSGPKSDAFEKYYELEKFQREVRNAKSQVRAKFEFFRNCLNSIENEKICELDVISAKYEELFSYHQANLFEMEIVKSRISKFKEANLQPALKKITSTLDNNKKMLEKSYIKIPDNFVTWNESSFEKTLQKLCNVVDIEGLKGLDFKQLPIDNVPLYTYTPHLSCTNEHGFTNVTEYQGPLDDKNPNPSEHRSQKKN